MNQQMTIQHFFNNGFGMIKPMKADILLNKNTKLDLRKCKVGTVAEGDPKVYFL